MRPFKDLQEFEATTYRTVGDTIVLRKKGLPETFEIGLITGYYFGTKFICINGAILSFEDLCYEYEFRATDDTWKALGIEDAKPAKFKVGKKYLCKRVNHESISVIINAKYKDPVSGIVKVVVNDISFSEVFTDLKDNENIMFLGDLVSAKNEVEE